MGFKRHGSTMILVLILVFNILASSQAKPATNMNIKEASITMGENENGNGDYHHEQYNRQINRFRHGQPGTITRPLPRPSPNRNVNELDVNQGSIDYNHRGGRPAVVNRCGGFLGLC